MEKSVLLGGTERLSVPYLKPGCLAKELDGTTQRMWDASSELWRSRRWKSVSYLRKSRRQGKGHEILWWYSGNGHCMWMYSLFSIVYHMYECFPWSSCWPWKKECSPGTISGPGQEECLKWMMTSNSKHMNHGLAKGESGSTLWNLCPEEPTRWHWQLFTCTRVLT